MKTKTLLASFGVAAAVLTFPSTSASQEAQFTLNFATVAPEGTPWANQLMAVKSLVEQGSGNRIKVKVFLSGSMGSEVEIARECRRGDRIQGVGVSTGALAEGAALPSLTLPELPYLFLNVNEADKVLDEVLYKPMSTELGKKGFVLHFWSENGWRHFATKGGPANTPEALAKFKMRAQESPVHLSMYKALGVNAVSKPITEVLPSLNTGIIDGYDNTALFALSAGLIDPITHFTLSYHIYQPAAIVYSKRWYDTLPADLQALLVSDVVNQTVNGRAAIRALDDDMIKIIQNTKKKTVVTLSPAERQAFAAKTKGVHTEYLGLHPEAKPLYDQVQAKLKTLR